MRTVGEVAELAGVTVRTLHHYDEQGLLSPSGRTEAGYRLYSGADLARLQEILVWRALGFPLVEIKALLDDPRHDRATALRSQRTLVGGELERLQAIAHALDRALAAHDHRTDIEEDQMFEGFDPHQYADEARERWGDTDVYKQSARRSAGYGEGEWAEIKRESAEIEEELAALLRAGAPADGEAACSAAQRHRAHISRWFYDCPPAMHAGLGEMYVADARFSAHYDAREPGLAGYVRDAIAANAEAQAQAARR
jgi:MerR family transcriptional regulator, thiopeptide resistance regulator